VPPETQAQPLEPASIPTPPGGPASEGIPGFAPQARSEDIVPAEGGDVTQSRTERQGVEPEDVP
jgi:hypothetical protein